MATFEQGLQAQLDADASLRKSAFGKRAREVLSWPVGDKRRKRILARMERHARVQLGKSDDANVNWAEASVDWKTIIQILIKLLPLLLMLL